MPHPNLIEPSELARYGVPGAFLRQFVPRAVQVKISTAGALGTMAVQVRLAGEENYDPTPITSSAGATWDLELTTQGTHCTLTFAAGTYTVDKTAVVSEAGVVTNGTGWTGTLTASRYDLRENGCAAATAEAYKLMANGITPPLTVWGADVKWHCGAIVHEFLRNAVGMTAEGTGVGDQNVMTSAAAARAFFGDIGRVGLSSDGMTDSATVDYGPLWVDSQSDDQRGW